MMQYNQSQFVVERDIPEHELIISRTDLQGKIVYANETFCEISGYTQEELLGKTHNIVRHPDMPKSIFTDLWQTLEAKKQWKGIVKNLCKDKSFYWVEAIISGVYKNGVLIEYKSQRFPISYANKLEYQILYDRIRKEHNEAIRTITYE